ncbi:MAG: excinuclease ABC subunit UvrC [Deltaproteobacteria bacterium]|nr:excinuclease ABC subunit UvrC [Deltaproteobacteria bacterium]
MSLAERIETLPTGPGVYLFKSGAGKVLYIGKAQNLRQRVRQYVSGGDGRIRIPLLVERARDVEVVVTKNVKDALLLENELIKQHKPQFNVRLRDDKQYLMLRLDPQAEWPRLIQVRRFQRDGADYFGPYTSSVSMKNAVSNLRRIFPLRSCRDAVFRDYARRERPCIEYEMKRCAGPCCGLVDRAGYAELVHGTTLFLRGQSGMLVEELRQRMLAASAGEHFEAAAALRNQIGAVERTVETQQIVAERPIDRDVFGLARRGGEVEVRVFHVREGRVVGSQGYGFSDVRIDDGEVMSSFLGQYYAPEEGRSVPAQVLTAAALDDAGAVEGLVSERVGRKVEVRAPRRGIPAELVQMANANAVLGLEQRLAARESLDAAFEELRLRLGLAAEPRRIECYDVSTLAGTLTVASRVVFEEGQPVKSDYRRYRIREAAPDDDTACLREVIQRRLARVEREPLPDLLMVDGGKGQLGVVTAALVDAGLTVECVGIAKERDAESPGSRVRRSGGLKAERLFRPERKDAVLLPANARGLLLLQRIRDESHRFAIEFQRELRSKLNFTSILEELPGIGPGKRRALLRQLGSLKAVRAASEESLAGVPGVSTRDAAMVRRFFDGLDSGREGTGPPSDEA